jgi:hypothetical protein
MGCASRPNRDNDRHDDEDDWLDDHVCRLQLDKLASVRGGGARAMTAVPFLDALSSNSVVCARSRVLNLHRQPARITDPAATRETAAIGRSSRPMEPCVRSDESRIALRRKRRGRCSVVNPTLGVALAAAMFLAAPVTLAEEVRISSRDCISGVHLVAHDAHLSYILKRMAEALDFKLRYDSENDPIVSVDADLQPGDLVARLLPLGNVSLAQARNPRCPSQLRIVNVWVLPKGTGSQSRPAVSPSLSGSLLETPEQLRQVQEGLEAHARAHGGGLDGSGQKASP